MEVAEKKKTGFKLPNKVVRVKFNPHNPGPIKNPKHSAYVKIEGCFDRYVCAVDRSGKRINPLTDEEKEFLEEALSLEKNDLSIYKKDGYYARLEQRPIALGKDPLILDLSDPQDYLTMKVLLTNREKVGPDIKDLKNKQYKYYIEDEESVAKTKKTESTIQMTAWKEYGKMEENRGKMISFLKVYSQLRGKSFTMYKVDRNSKLELIQSKLIDIISSDIKAFVEIIENEHFETILLIAESIESREIEKQGTKYFLKGGVDKIGDSLIETIQYLNNGSNADLRLILETNNSKS